MSKTKLQGRRLLAFCLCLCCLVGTLIPVTAVPQQEQPQFFYTSLVRSGPWASAPVLGQMSDGTALTVLETNSTYYRIDCYGRDGYIAKSQVRTEDGKYYVNCITDSQDTNIMPCVELADALLLRSAILALAHSQLRTRYVYGGMKPGGFDCSGLTSYVFAENGFDLHRCADDQMQDGLIICREGLQVGDLVFFRESWSPWLASHVGIYAGNGQLIHAKSGGVCYSDLDSDWYARYYVGARRIVNVQALTTTLTPAGAESAVSYSAGLGMRTIAPSGN